MQYKVNPSCKLLMIVAIGQNLEIGQNGTMPWYLPEDLAHFKKETSNSCVIMGRRTFESIGRPLPKRRNIVISSNKSLAQEFAEQIEVVSSLQEAVVLAKTSTIKESTDTLDSSEVCTYDKIFIIGGNRVFAEGLNIVDEVIVTHILASFPDADTFFPDFLQKEYSFVKSNKDFGGLEQHKASLAQQNSNLVQQNVIYCTQSSAKQKGDFAFKQVSTDLIHCFDEQGQTIVPIQGHLCYYICSYERNCS